MRISTSMQYNSHLHYLQHQNSELDAASKRYNTGQRFETAGESPSGMGMKIRYDSQIAQMEQYKKNAGVAGDYLAESETTVQNMWDVLNNVQSRLIQAANGVMDQHSMNALAEDLEQAQTQLFDLMNTKNAEGEYIFAGSTTTRPPFIEDRNGRYICQADGNQRHIQASPTVTVQATESGLNIFQNVPLAHNIKDPVNVQGQAAVGGVTINPLQIKSTEIENQGFFDSFFRDFFVNPDSRDTTLANINQLHIQVDSHPELPAVGPQGEQTFLPRTYTITAPGAHGNFQTITGEIGSDGIIKFNGMAIDVGKDKSQGGSFDLELEPPRKDNILNVLEDMIDTLRDEDMPSLEKSKAIATTQFSVTNAQVNYDLYRGEFGARHRNIETVLTSNEAISIIKQETRASVVEVDTFEAVSDMMKIQYGLQAAQQSYAMVHGSSLFDFIR